MKLGVQFGHLIGSSRFYFQQYQIQCIYLPKSSGSCLIIARLGLDNPVGMMIAFTFGQMALLNFWPAELTKNTMMIDP